MPNVRHFTDTTYTICVTYSEPHRHTATTFAENVAHMYVGQAILNQKRKGREETLYILLSLGLK